MEPGKRTRFHGLTQLRCATAGIQVSYDNERPGRFLNIRARILYITLSLNHVMTQINNVG